MSEPTFPSGEAVSDVAMAIERLLAPDEELTGVLFLAQARTPDGQIKNRVYFQPPERQDRLLKTMRDYLAGPPPGMKEYRTE